MGNGAGTDNWPSVHLLYTVVELVNPYSLVVSGQKRGYSS